MRLDELRKQLIARFSASDSPALDADCLLAAVLNKSRTWLRTWPEAEALFQQVRPARDCEAVTAVLAATGVLTPAEADHLFRILRGFQSGGGFFHGGRPGHATQGCWHFRAIRFPAIGGASGPTSGAPGPTIVGCWRCGRGLKTLRLLWTGG